MTALTWQLEFPCRNPLMHFAVSRFPARVDIIAVVSLFPDLINFINADNAVLRRAGPDISKAPPRHPPSTSNYPQPNYNYIQYVVSAITNSQHVLDSGILMEISFLISR